MQGELNLTGGALRAPLIVSRTVRPSALARLPHGSTEKTLRAAGLWDELRPLPYEQYQVCYVLDGNLHRELTEARSEQEAIENIWCYDYFDISAEKVRKHEDHN